MGGALMGQYAVIRKDKIISTDFKSYSDKNLIVSTKPECVDFPEMTLIVIEPNIGSEFFSTEQMIELLKLNAMLFDNSNQMIEWIKENTIQFETEYDMSLLQRVYNGIKTWWDN